MCENCAALKERICQLQAKIAVLTEELDKAEMQKVCAASEIRGPLSNISTCATLIEECATKREMGRVIQLAQMLHPCVNRIIASIDKELLTFSPRR